MSNEAPTDALRLVPVSLISDTMNAMARAYERIHSMPRVSDTELAKKVDEAKERLRPYLAAPASPLPEGGGWQDKAEGLESDLRQAVLVAWKRGAEEWCRLNYPQWIEWLEACQPAAPTGAK